MITKKKLQATVAPPYDSEYDAFVRGLELVGLALKSCRCEIDRGAYFSLEKSEKSFSHRYRLTDIGEKSFDAEGDFELFISESDETAAPLKMECIYEVHFHGDPPVSKEYADRFVGSELRLILVPHARQLFFALSGHMSIPSVVVPLTTRSETPKVTTSKRSRALEKKAETD